jgi:hypothetical protein
VRKEIAWCNSLDYDGKVAQVIYVCLSHFDWAENFLLARIMSASEILILLRQSELLGYKYTPNTEDTTYGSFYTEFGKKVGTMYTLGQGWDSLFLQDWKKDLLTHTLDTTNKSLLGNCVSVTFWVYEFLSKPQTVGSVQTQLDVGLMYSIFHLKKKIEFHSVVCIFHKSSNGIVGITYIDMSRDLK